jgi:hypothetical protein
VNVLEPISSLDDISAIYAFEANYWSYFILDFPDLISRSTAITAMMMKYSFMLIIPVTGIFLHFNLPQALQEKERFESG